MTAITGTGEKTATVSNDKWHVIQEKAPDNSTALLAKRVLDITLASVAMLLFLPALIVIAVLIRLDSRGPVLFRQARVGKDGKMFTMYKFRSMHNTDNSEVHQNFVRSLFSDHHRHTGDGAVYKVAGDGRITRAGAFLRKTSLDELPQLINVLKGEMSLVGPRPDLPYSVELYDRHHLQRLAVLPGITGLWQVSGRSKKSLLEMLDLDVAYVNKWTFWLDIKIIARTIIVVITGQGAS